MSNIMKKRSDGNEDGAEQRKGPWTLEEDTLLTNYIANNGEGRWNLLAKSSGLKRKGKSCRLRWLNYLKPDIKRGNLTSHEQILILELHCKLGNRWSKIAQYLPGRTDNEIKNYWRTRIQKQARQLNIDSSSHKFLEVVRSFWFPELIHNSDTNTKAPLPELVGSGLRDNQFSHEPGFNNMGSFTSMPQDFSNLETSEVYWDGSKGSSNQCVSEEYRSFTRLNDENMLATMDNSDILPLHDCPMVNSNYEENVTQDPIWNMDDIWQFKEYTHFN